MVGRTTQPAAAAAAAEPAPAADPAAATRAGSPPALPRISVVIAVRDEILALPALIRDLGRQDHRTFVGSPAFDVVVVDDRSTDGSGSAARTAADEAGIGGVTAVVRRQAGARPDGKGAALAAVPDELLHGDAVLVFDADARIGTDLVRRVAERVGDGCPAFTARRRVAGSDLGAVVQDDEQTVDTLIQRARGGLGGCPEFRGNGMVVTTAHLRAIGGWRAGALTEDLDLSTRLAIGGTRVVLAEDLEVWEAPTASLAAFTRQRVRWAEGSVRRFLDLLPAAITSPELALQAKADLASSAAQLLLPIVVLGAVFDGTRRRAPLACAGLRRRMRRHDLGARVDGAARRHAWSTAQAAHRRPRRPDRGLPPALGSRDARGAPPSRASARGRHVRTDPGSSPPAGDMKASQRRCH